MRYFHEYSKRRLYLIKKLNENAVSGWKDTRSEVTHLLSVPGAFTAHEVEVKKKCPSGFC